MSSPPSDLVNCFPCCPLPPGTEPSTIASITLKLWRPFQADFLTLIENIYIHLHWWLISWSFHDTKKAAYLCWKCVKFEAGGWYMLDSPVTWTSSWGWPCPPRSRSWRCWGCTGCSTWRSGGPGADPAATPSSLTRWTFKNPTANVSKYPQLLRCFHVLTRGSGESVRLSVDCNCHFSVAWENFSGVKF